MPNWLELLAVSPVASPVNTVAILEEMLDRVDAVSQETERAIQQVASQALVLPPEAIRLVFWYAALTNPPTTTTSLGETPHSWLAILRVCRAWYHIALTDSVLMAETYTHRPYQACTTGSLAGDEPLHYNATVGCLANKSAASSLALHHVMQATDFNRVGRLVLHRGADIEGHVARLSELSMGQPLQNLTSLIIEAGTPGTVPSLSSSEEDKWSLTPVCDRCIHAPRLKEAVFTNFWIPLLSHELSTLSITFSSDASVRPSSSDILIGLCGGGVGGSLQSLDLLEVVHAHQTSPSLNDLDMSFPVLQRVRVHDYPGAAIDLLSKLVWAMDSGAEMKTTLTHDGAAEIVGLASVFEEIPVERLQISCHRLSGAAGYRMVCRCWTLFHRGGLRRGDSVPPQLNLDITVPTDTLPWIEVVQLFVDQWFQANIRRLELDVSPDMFTQTSCLHWQGLFAHLPELLRFDPVETVHNLIASCDRDHGGQVDHGQLLAMLCTL
ncbi:hypothetical protein PENSPDRAFT_693414 [Peniophora sp. CONT]|nr:hypothetical protein PENSPDRAFT_693414 [Peniophora sp. CONT]